MPRLTFEGREHSVAPGQTVLAALEAAGETVESSCRAGICQTCLVRAESGTIPKAAQAGLPEGLVAEGYFMACVCTPDSDMVVTRAEAVRPHVRVTVDDVTFLSTNVVRLRITPQTPFSYRPGQFLGLVLPDAAPRSYSIASLPQRDPWIELHIRLIPGGLVSTLVSRSLRAGDRLDVVGPSGSCVYPETAFDRPLVLAGTGTGLAPLWGILQDALERGHTGPIRLYHGALSCPGLYLVDELEALARRHPQLTYRPCIQDEGASGDLCEAVLGGESAPADSEFFLCGDPTLVGRLKRALFLKGAKLPRIHADPFIPTAAPAISATTQPRANVG